MGAIVNLLIGVVIVFLPLFTKVAAYDMSRVSKDNLMVILLGLCSFLLPKKVRQLSVIGYMALAYGLFILVFNQWNPLSISVQYQTFYISASLIFFACFYEKHSRKGLNYILNGMAIGCILQSLIVIVSFLGYPAYFKMFSLFMSDITEQSITTKGIGSLGQSNLLSAYVALTSVALFRKNLYRLLPLPLIALVIANSMMGYATFAAGIVFFINLEFKLVKGYVLYIMASVAMIAAYFTGLAGADTARFASWKEIFSRIDLAHFLFGKGPGWFFDHPVRTGLNEIMKQEHNEFISALNIFGVIGIVLFIATMAPAITGSKDKLFQAVLFAGFCNSYGNFVFHQSSSALILIVALAICLAEGRSHVFNLER